MRLRVSHRRLAIAPIIVAATSPRAGLAGFAAETILD